MPDAHRGQKKALGYLKLGLGMVVSCYEPNSGPLKEQTKLLTVELSLQPVSVSELCN